jgi:integral membrane protein (TIGR00529 family)
MIPAIPALVKTAITFTVIIFAIRKNISLANAFMVGALLLAVFFDLSFEKTAAAIADCFSDPKTISLCIIVALILTVSSSLEQSGQLKRLLTTFRGLIKNPKLNLALFPAIIGLLPMPGGTVFSAPMVKELGGESDLPPGHLSYINYWFRHIWEYWWPMYPGVLLATLLADINLAEFVTMMFPFTLVVIFIGWIPVEKDRLPRAVSDAATDKKIMPFLREIAPILLIVAAGIALGWGFSTISRGFVVAKETGLIVSLCAGNWMVWRVNAMTTGQIRKIMISPHVFNMVYMMAAILFFKQILENSGAVEAICSELISLQIPLLLIWGILPFVVGLLTGITIAFVGSSFPILITLTATRGQEQLMMPYIMLALSCGFVGVLLSPVHLCLLVSNHFFGTTLNAVYRLLWLPCLCLVGCAFGYFALLSRVLG